MRDRLGRERKASQGAGRSGLPSKGGARTGRPLSVEPPAHLGKDGAEWYRWAVGMACEMGIADEADASAFESAAEIFQQMRIAQRDLKKYGQVLSFLDLNGKPVRRVNPSFHIAQRCQEVLRLFRSDLGLSPAARAKFAQGADQEQDPFEALLSG